MYKIIKKPLTANIVWDAEKNAPLGVFRDGVFLTDDKSVADKFEGLGYSVEESEKTDEKTDEKADEKADGTDEKAGKKNAAGKK